MDATATPRVDGVVIRKVAVYADDSHPDTVRRYFAGMPVRAASRARIERALLRLGLAHLARGPVFVAGEVPR
jgi:hypothetical protein